MNCDKNSLLLYAVTDRAWLQPGETLLGRVRDAIEGGATFVQLREKDLDPAAFLAEGREIGALKEKLAEKGLLERASMVANCGMEGEAVYPRFAELTDGSGYFSVVLVKKGEEA